MNPSMFHGQNQVVRHSDRLDRDIRLPACPA